MRPLSPSLEELATRIAVVEHSATATHETDRLKFREAPR